MAKETECESWKTSGQCKEDAGWKEKWKNESEAGTGDQKKPIVSRGKKEVVRRRVEKAGEKDKELLR